MIKIFLWIILLSISSLTPQSSSTDIVCISLGKKCSPALNFKRHNISKAYYPFDFIETPFDGLCMLLKNKFKDFSLKEALKTTGFALSREDPTTTTAQIPFAIVENQVTKCIFYHDFKGNNLDNYDTVAAKFQRRIDRFYKTIEETKHIFFFRTYLTKPEAAVLYQLLKQLFPQKSFSLIVPTKTEYMQQPWNLPGVQEFPLLVKKVRRFPFLTRKIVESTRDHGRDEDWDHIFRVLKLI